MTEISQNIRKFRKQQGLSQNELAEQLHVTRQTVSSWETDKSYPDLEMVVRLSEVLRTDPNRLLYPPSAQQGTPYRRVSFRAVLGTVVGFFVAIVLLGGLWGVLFTPIIGGGPDETLLYPIYAGVILLSGVVVFCTCLVLDEIRKGAYYRENQEES